MKGWFERAPSAGSCKSIDLERGDAIRLPPPVPAPTTRSRVAWPGTGGENTPVPDNAHFSIAPGEHVPAGRPGEGAGAWASAGVLSHRQRGATSSTKKGVLSSLKRMLSGKGKESVFNSSKVSDTSLSAGLLLATLRLVAVAAQALVS